MQVIFLRVDLGASRPMGTALLQFVAGMLCLRMYERAAERALLRGKASCPLALAWYNLQGALDHDDRSCVCTVSPWLHCRSGGRRHCGADACHPCLQPGR